MLTDKTWRILAFLLLPLKIDSFKVSAKRQKMMRTKNRETKNGGSGTSAKKVTGAL
jgi:hypothetical protein